MSQISGFKSQVSSPKPPYQIELTLHHLVRQFKKALPKFFEKRGFCSSVSDLPRDLVEV